jgi:hypothetical protein
MEKFPGSKPTSSVEKKPERILSSGEVLEAISQYAEGFTLSRELSDGKGVYLREVEIAGEKESEFTEYQYKRKGIFPNNNTSDATVINRIDYQDGMPAGGERIAILNEETGMWEAV